VNFFLSYEKEHDLEINGWTFKRIGKNIFQVYPTPSPHSITMTGADVTTSLTVPFPHRWIRLTFLHTDNAYTPQTISELAITFQRSQGQATPDKFAEVLYHDEYLIDPYITARGGETHEYESSVYKLILNSTNTHLIFPNFYLQQLETQK
jgi:hypothetical protein